MTYPASAPDRLVGIHEARAITGQSRSGLYAKIRRGLFPRQVSPSGTRRALWSFNELQQYIADKLAERDAGVSRRVGSSASAPRRLGQGAGR